MVARYSFHLNLYGKHKKRAPHFRMVVMSFIRKQEIRQHLGMLCLENSPFFMPRVICRDTEAAADLSHSWEQTSQGSWWGCCLQSVGSWLTSDPCLTASTLVILLGNKLEWGSNYAADNEVMNERFKSRSLEGGWWLWLKGWGEVKSHKTNRFLDTFFKSMTVMCSLKSRIKTTVQRNCSLI